jgi:hypothetical protein
MRRASGFRALKKGLKGPAQRIAMIADGLPAHGDAPPKYDNKISHSDPVRLLCFATNLTLPRVDVKRFHAAVHSSFLRLRWRTWIAACDQALPR